MDNFLMVIDQFKNNILLFVDGADYGHNLFWR